MTPIEIKYGFPLFSRENNTVYLGNSKKIVISDIWSFWDYVIKKFNYEKEYMNSLLEQAKHFYNAAENSPVKSKPLLYYYSFLNLSKVIINIDKKYGQTRYMHGIGANHNNRFIHSTLRIAEKKSFLKNISIELSESLDGFSINYPLSVNVKDYMMHCIGVHRAYSEIYNLEEIFFRIEDLKVFKSGKKIISRFKVCAPQDKISSLQDLGYNIIEDEENFYWQEEVLTSSYSMTRNAYYLLSQHLRNKGIWYFVNNDGYTLYISNSSINRYPPEIIIYNTMFFLGSITRYHPYMFDQIFSDKEQWLMSEFLTTQPKQFLYLSTAKILGQTVYSAYTKF